MPTMIKKPINRIVLTTHYDAICFYFTMDMMDYMESNKNNGKIIYCGRQMSMTNEFCKKILSLDTDFYYDYHHKTLIKGEPHNCGKKGMVSATTAPYLIIEKNIRL